MEKTWLRATSIYIVTMIESKQTFLIKINWWIERGFDQNIFVKDFSGQQCATMDWLMEKN